VVAVACGIYWKKANEIPPRPASVASVTPKEIMEALARSKEAGAAKGGKGVLPVLPVEVRADLVFERTGPNALQVQISNKNDKPAKVSLKAGDVFENGEDSLVLLKPYKAEAAPGAKMTGDLVVAVTNSANQGTSGTFKGSPRTFSKLTALLRHLETNPDIPLPVVQTAVLALTEDAPVDLFAQFPRLQPQPSYSIRNFKVETAEIIAAAQTLRDIGVNATSLAQDPQLKIEAMMDRRSHDIASRYYGIGQESEWDFWRNQLLQGDPSTRHYALYGIARFYPDVALQMMPKWALEIRTMTHYRKAAIGALALTQKLEARQILQALERELSKENELAQYVGPALRYLEQNVHDAL
jgi:hypothetical protein